MESIAQHHIEIEQIKPDKHEASNSCISEEPISRRRAKRNVRRIELDANTSAWLTAPPVKVHKKHFSRDIGQSHKNSSKGRSIWTMYLKKIARQLQRLEFSKGENKSEFPDGKINCSHADSIIILRVLDTLNQLESENGSHKRHPEFSGPGEEFNVDNITCSKCDGMDSEFDDLYFCDAQSCCRAYHLRCLEPPVSRNSISTDPEDDWFCNQCRCTADCLVLINQSFGSYFQNMQELREAIQRMVVQRPSDSEDSLDQWATTVPDSQLDRPIKRSKSRSTMETVSKASQKKGRVTSQKRSGKAEQTAQSKSRRTEKGCRTELAPVDSAVDPSQKCTTTTTPIDNEQNNAPRPSDDYFFYSDGVTPSHWRNCYLKINKYVLDIHKLDHLIQVLSTNGHNDGVLLSDELRSTLKKSDKCKRLVREWLNAILEPNKEHRRYAELDAVDDDDMVEVETVNCSKCGLPDDEGNDILFCDRKTCCRAYHASCLDPPADLARISSDPNDDWFCWECRCVADSLALINELCGTKYEDGVDEVFADLIETEDSVIDGLLNDGEAWGGDSSSEDDDDYMPKSHRRRVKKKERRNDRSETQSLVLDAGESAMTSQQDASSERESESESDSESDSDEDNEGTGTDEFDEDGSDNQMPYEQADRDDENEQDCEDFDDDPRDDLESELSGNELDELMADAGMDGEEIPLAAGWGYSGDNCDDSAKARLISGRLRKRKVQSNEDDLPEGFVPLSRFSAAAVELNFPLAKVKYGRFVLGKVVGLPDMDLLESDEVNSKALDKKEKKWQVCFDDKQDELTSLGLNDLLLAYECRLDYEKRAKRLSAQEVANRKAIELEKLSEENVLNAKRLKQKLDYAQLHIEMFGAAEVSSSDDEDFCDDAPPSPVLLQKKRRRVSTKTEISSQSADYGVVVPQSGVKLEANRIVSEVARVDEEVTGGDC